jgi:bifunctional DNA-binding transcriptional regulator/antitoxin component of YhaV-PrlF toxin-antitoxin module
MATQFTTEIDEKGRVAIAPELLSSLRLSPGATLLLEEKEGRIMLEPVSEEAELIEKDGLLVVRPRVTGNLMDCVQQDRDERILQFTKDLNESSL